MPETEPMSYDFIVVVPELVDVIPPDPRNCPPIIAYGDTKKKAIDNAKKYMEKDKKDWSSSELFVYKVCGEIYPDE